MTNISTLGQAFDQIERIKTMQTSLATLQYQIASGKKTNLFKGLGSDVIFSERSRANFTSLDKFMNNIDIANRRMKLMEKGLSEIQTQTRNVVGSLEVETQQGEFDMHVVGDLANNVYDYLLDLINVQDGDRYLYGGAETLTKPLTDAGAMDTYLSTQLNDWIAGNIDNQQLMDSFTDRTQLNDTLVGYSAPLASGNAKDVFVRVDDHAEIEYTTLANSDGLRDILVAVSMIKKITSTMDEVTRETDDPVTLVTSPGATKQEQNDNFYTVYNKLAEMLTGALDKIDTQRFNLSQKQAQITQIQNGHKQEQATLLDTISNVEDADVNEIAVKLNAMQVQLEASFRVTASLQSLSLVNFMPL
ncbi:MAG TPA: flagellin [Alphaproteobacteria bacterium]|jgi:flagellar hook-associated protein 3 FlgL